MGSLGAQRRSGGRKGISRAGCVPFDYPLTAMGVTSETLGETLDFMQMSPSR